MRPFLQKIARAGVVAALIPFATCSDFTGPSGRGVQVPVVPTFSPAATFATALYSAAGLEFDRVRVLIVRGETILKDTSVAFSPTSAELTLPLVIAAAPGEVVTATLEYRSADLVLYSGSASVTTLPVGAPQTSATPIVLQPVGPGASTDKVDVSPALGTFPITDAVTFAAHAFDATGAPITNAIFGWSVDDPAVATVNAQGVVQPTSKGGVAHVRATTLNGKFAEAAVTFVTAPASLALVSGGAQSAMAFEPLAAPIVLKVLDQNGNAVAGAAVGFAVVTGGGTLLVLNEVSDAAGLVSVKWKLGGDVGAQSVKATAAALPDAPLTITATATERPAAALAFKQQPTKSIMGAAISPAVMVKALDDKGRAVTGFTGEVTIVLGANPNAATLGGTTTVAAVNGIATFSTLSVSAAGTGYGLKATAAGLTAALSEPFAVDQVPSGLSLFAGGSQTAAIRSTLAPIGVKVADANGIGVAGITVAFEVVRGRGTLDVASGVTDASGLAKVIWTLGDSVGSQAIRATVGGLTGSPLVVEANATPLPAIGLAFLQGPSNVVINAGMSPAVTVKALDADGNVVTGFTGTIALTLEVNPNSATLGGTTSAAAVNGVATFENLSVNVAGSGYKLKAASGTLAPALSGTFVVSPPPATAVKFRVQPSNVLTGVAIVPAVEVKIVDASGNTVPGAVNAVVISLQPNANGGVVTGDLNVNAVNGVAAFSTLKIDKPGTYAFKATAVGLTEDVSSSFSVTVAPQSRMWVGSISRDWHTAGNWSPAGVPAAEDSATIVSSATNQPLVAAAAVAKAIIIESGASLEINAPSAALTTPTILNRGTLKLTSAAVVGDIENRGTMVVDGSATATSVTATSTATTRIVGTTVDGAALVVARGFVNEGALELTDVNGTFAEIVVNDSLVNRSGATITAADGIGGDRAMSGVLRNYGTITVASSRGLDMVLTAAGSVNAGTISFTNGGSFFQSFADSTITFTNTGLVSMGTATWDPIFGNLRLREGTVTGTGKFSSFESQLDVDFSKFGLTMVIDPDTRFAGSSVLVPSGATASIIGSTFIQKVEVLGTLYVRKSAEVTSFSGGLAVATDGVVHDSSDARVDGSFDIAARGKLRLVATADTLTFETAAGFTNQGAIEMTSAGLWPVFLDVGGTLVNGTNGTISALGGMGGERRIAATLDNQGAISVEGTSFMKLRRGGATHSNTGTITLLNAVGGASPTAENLTSFTIQGFETGSVLKNTGMISIGNNRAVYVEPTNTLDNQAGGTVGGTGKLRVPDGATFANAGIIAPGGQGATGTLTYEGNLDARSGQIEIEFADTSPGRYDILVVTGAVSVGNLKVTRINGFTLPVSRVQVIQAASHDVNGLAILDALLWGWDNDGNGVFVHTLPALTDLR